MTTLPVAAPQRGLLDSFSLPLPGEVTGAQNRAGSAAGMARAKGFDAPEPGSIRTWKKMRSDPMIAMARVAGTALIKASRWRYEAADEDVPDEVVEFVQAQLDPRRRELVRNCLFALDYGFQAFEKVYQPVRFQGRTFMGYKRFKPLTPDDVEILQLDTTGEFAGVAQKDVTLGPDKCLVFSYDSEAGNPYGRPRHENCRTEWSAKRQTLDKLGVLITKVTNVVPIMQYPPGRGVDANGATVDNFDIARAMLRDLSRGVGVALPNTLAKHVEQLINRGMKPEDLRAWILTFVETTPGHGAEVVEILDYLNKEIVRGWLSPERSVTEAITAGSRADSSTAADVSILIQQDTLLDVVECVQRDVVDPLVRLNGGADYVGRVQIVPEALEDEEWQMVKEITTKVLTDPNNTDLAFRLLNFDSMIDQLGLPRAMDAAKALAEQQDVQDLQKQLEDALKQGNSDPNNPAGDE